MTRMPDAVEVDVGARPGVEGARRATGGRDPAPTLPARAPDPEVPAKVERRRFPPAYRLRILKEVDACKRPGEVGALQAMRGRHRGPTPRPVDPRVKQLEAENRRLQRKLQRAETIITLQKKLPRSWGSP